MNTAVVFINSFPKGDGTFQEAVGECLFRGVKGDGWSSVIIQRERERGTENEKGLEGGSGSPEGGRTGPAPSLPPHPRGDPLGPPHPTQRGPGPMVITTWLGV